jgi:hypothetical protein
MTVRLPSPTLLIAGSFLAAFSMVSAFAETTTGPNPFGDAAQAQAIPAQSKPRAAAAPKAGQFASEADAKASCPSDKVVWVNLGTKVYHHAGAATYGKTKRGVYMCEKDTAAAGFRAAKNEKQ